MLLQADAFHIPLPDKSVHCCVTSPPYWGLRKYAGDQGDDPLGLESTPERHMERTVLWAREVWRVLRDDGVFWLNYGDCFAGSWGNYGSRDGGQRSKNTENFSRPAYESNKGRPPTSYYQQGNLMLMPHKIAIALQEDGWIVRNDLVWMKRNPMPESVAGWRWERAREEKERIEDGGAQMTNLASMDAGISGGKDKVIWEYGDDYILRKGSWRHTRQHEYVFMLVKQMGYWCNQEAVRVQASDNTHHRGYKLSPPKEVDGVDQQGHKDWTKLTPDILPSRNPRSVLDVPTAPYSGAHYATFPPDLIAPLIRASCPRRCCPECGQGWSPVVERGNKYAVDGRKNWGKEKPDDGTRLNKQDEVWNRKTPMMRSMQYKQSVIDYRPTCECGHDDYVPGIVLDPFGGSGTTGMVAKQLMRRWVVMDLSRPYLDEQAKIRTGTGSPKNALDGLPLFEVNDAT